ncbi:replication protein A, subunit RPA32 [Mycena olivaceomarginata]|nr:replication protein A, subunit RPA32 [Mycena olivaceomarginata]
MSGYNNSQAGGWSPGSQGSPSTAKSQAAQSLRPVTLAQVRKATQMHSDADWVIDKHPIGQITVVAELFYHAAYATNRNFGIDDGTARMEVKMWLETPEDQLDAIWRGLTLSKHPGGVKPVFVRVTGSIKTHNNKRHIHASNIRLVKEPSEVYFHILEVISTNVTLQKGLPSSSGQPQEQQSTTSNADSHSAYTIQSRPSQAQKLFSPMADEVVHYLRTAPPNPEGIFVGDIARALGCNAMELSTTVDRLIDDGHIFTTIDDSHIQLAA